MLNEQLHFTTRVLGAAAAYRLENHQVTQSLRSESDTIVNAFLLGRVSAGDKLEITLDTIIVGHAALISMDKVTWEGLGSRDARRGGLGDLFELGQALQRAGCRFMPLNHYELYRIQFSWLEEAYA